MNFYNEVLDVLKSDERFFSDDGQLLRNAVYEAAMQMDLLEHDFFVFLNAETDDVNVVYRRKNGDYGLIEPTFA